MTEAGPVDAVVFSGASQWLGVGVLGLFGLVLGVLALGLVAVAVTGQYSPAWKMWLGALPCALIAALLLHDVYGSFRRFSRIDIAADGAWSLRNFAGHELMRLGPKDLRAVETRKRTFLILSGTSRIARSVYVFIETPDGRSSQSVYGPARDHQQAIDKLQTIIKARANYRSPEGTAK